MVPFDDKSPFVTSGIRIGTPAISTRGLLETDMVRVVEYLDQIIMDPENEKLQTSVKGEINDWMVDYSLYPKMKG